jgi:hypothetical protein
VIEGRVRGSGAGRWAAGCVLALALPAVPVAAAAAGATSAPAILAAGAAALAALAAWLGPAAWPGTARAPAVERVLVTATIAWAAALDAVVAGMAVHGGGVSLSPAVVMLTALAYALGSAWSIRIASEVWWRWPVACALAAVTWIVLQAAV